MLEAKLRTLAVLAPRGRNGVSSVRSLETDFQFVAGWEQVDSWSSTVNGGRKEAMRDRSITNLDIASRFCHLQEKLLIERKLLLCLQPDSGNLPGTG